MRVTNAMMRRAAVSHLQTNTARMAEAQERVSSGRRMLKASDAPSAAAAAMRARSPLRAIEQYQSNIDTAASRALAEETALDSTANLLIRAKEVGIGQAGATATAQTRLAIKAEVDQLFDHMVQLANTRLGDDYLFGGTRGDMRPYAVDASQTDGFSSTSPSGEPQVEIAEGRYLTVGHNGVSVFEDTGALAALHRLSQALGANDQTAITAALGGVDEAFDGVQTLIGDVGARTNHLDLTRSSLDALSVSLQDRRADLEEIEVEEAVTELASRQTALQAAMLATSRVMSLSLADYLR